MSAQSQYEREEQAIIEAEERGIISHAEAMKQLQELQRDYRWAARESAARAHERELEQW